MSGFDCDTLIGSVNQMRMADLDPPADEMEDINLKLEKCRLENRLAEVEREANEREIQRKLNHERIMAEVDREIAERELNRKLRVEKVRREIQSQIKEHEFEEKRRTIESRLRLRRVLHEPPPSDSEEFRVWLRRQKMIGDIVSEENETDDEIKRTLRHYRRLEELSTTGNELDEELQQTLRHYRRLSAKAIEAETDALHRRVLHNRRMRQYRLMSEISNSNFVSSVSNDDDLDREFNETLRRCRRLREQSAIDNRRRNLRYSRMLCRRLIDDLSYSEVDESDAEIRRTLRHYRWLSERSLEIERRKRRVKKQLSHYASCY